MFRAISHSKQIHSFIYPSIHPRTFPPIHPYVPNIRANASHLTVLERTMFVRSGRKLKLSSDCGDSGSKKCKRSYAGSYYRVWQSLLFAGVKFGAKAVGLLWCVWQDSGFSYREDFYAFNLVYKEIYICSLLTCSLLNGVYQ
jgi:hypothetical protein